MLTGAVLQHAPYRGRRLLVLIVLADAASNEGEVTVSVGSMAPCARTTPNEFWRELAVLKADGRVLSTPRPGHTSVHQLRFPPEWGTLSAAVTGEKPAPKPSGKPRRKARKPKSEPIPAPEPAPELSEPTAAGADDPERYPEPAPLPTTVYDLSAYRPLPGVWRRIAAIIASGMPDQAFHTLYGGAKLYAPRDDPRAGELDAQDCLLVCRSLTAWRLASNQAGMERLINAVLRADGNFTILPVPPAAVALPPMEESAHASN